jgi:signal transduction histidine kinase
MRGALILRVTNTVAAERPSGDGGIGLRNVRDRLTIQFGERASFSAGRDGREWVAEIHMPLLTDVLETAAGTTGPIGHAAPAEPL